VNTVTKCSRIKPGPCSTSHIYLRGCLCTECLLCTSLVPEQYRAQCGVEYTVNHYGHLAFTAFVIWSIGKVFPNCTINGLPFQCIDELPRDGAFVFVHLPLRGGGLNRRFLSSARSVHDPHMNCGRGLFTAFHSLLSCCCIMTYRMVKTRGSLSYTTRMCTSEI